MVPSDISNEAIANALIRRKWLDTIDYNRYVLTYTAINKCEEIGIDFKDTKKVDNKTFQRVIIK